MGTFLLHLAQKLPTLRPEADGMVTEVQQDPITSLGILKFAVELLPIS